METQPQCFTTPCNPIGTCVSDCNYADPTRHYIGKSASECSVIKFACQVGQVGFVDACGCGCQEVCATGKCGPALGLPNHLCADGSWAGPTGNCLKHADGTCGWEVLSCN